MKPRKYEVISLSVGGSCNKIYHSGDVVTDTNFAPNMAEKLVKNGFLKPTTDHLLSIKTDFNPENYPIKQWKSVTIATMMWQRHDIFKVWAKSVKRLIDSFPEAKIDVLVVGSEGGTSRLLVDSFGFEYLEHENQPLSNKANARLKRCERFGNDYVLLLGSDDVISNSAFHFMQYWMGEGFDVISPMDIFYFDTTTHRSAYSKGYIGRRSGESLAVGRCMSKEFLERCNYRLWIDGLESSLDRSIKRTISRKAKSEKTYRCEDVGIIICDIKSITNITKFKWRDNYEEISNETLFNQIPELCNLKK